MRELSTQLCNEIYYRDLDVCLAEDAAHAIKRFEYEISDAEWRLQKLPAGAEDIEVFESSIATYKVELAAVRDLIAGRLDYCNAVQTQ